MLCPHCKDEISITEHMSVCPSCGGNIEIDVKNQLTAEEFVRELINTFDREKIEALLVNDQRTEARMIIRKIRNRRDIHVEVRILKIIEQTSTNESLRLHVQKVEAERAWKKEHPLLTHCSACGKEISIKAELCPNCGNPTGVKVCPRCSGTNTKTISGASKATSVFLWGPFAANKVVSKFQCKDCGYKF